MAACKVKPWKLVEKADKKTQEVSENDKGMLEDDLAYNKMDVLGAKYLKMEHSIKL